MKKIIAVLFITVSIASAAHAADIVYGYVHSVDEFERLQVRLQETCGDQNAARIGGPHAVALLAWCVCAADRGKIIYMYTLSNGARKYDDRIRLMKKLGVMSSRKRSCDGCVSKGGRAIKIEEIYSSGR